MTVRRVSEHMSALKHWVKADDPLTQAKELMQLHAVRHLPVVKGDTLVGLISLGDLYAMEAVHEADPDRTHVSEAMSRDVLQVAPDAPLGEVARQMADARVGSAVVMAEGAIVGVFTGTDACRVLAEVLAEDVS